jgi:hypothetical protein
MELNNHARVLLSMMKGKESEEEEEEEERKEKEKERKKEGQSCCPKGPHHVRFDPTNQRRVNVIAPIVNPAYLS